MPPRLRPLLAEGVTTVEIKSGYGLDLDELKQLRAARRVGRAGAGSGDDDAAGAACLAAGIRRPADDFVDARLRRRSCRRRPRPGSPTRSTCSASIAFSPAQCERVFATARRARACRSRAIWSSSRTWAAARWRPGYGALSVDHIEYLDEAGVEAIAASGTAAVLLPGAFYFLREKQAPPVAALRRAGVPMAVATDLNPGTSPFASLRLMANMACILFGLTVEEALAGMTREAARALGLAGRRGVLAPGMDADLASGPWTTRTRWSTSRWRRGCGSGCWAARSSGRQRMIGTRLSNRVVRAPRGPVRTCKSWLTEAAYRMAQNNLDPEVAEHPEALVVYGGIGRAARNWECFDRILEVLQRLEDDETLLVQSGKPVGVFHTHADAPRVLHRQLQPRAALGDLGALPRARSQGPDDVRPDDRRLLDLHRQPGHRAGHLRDLRRDRPTSISAASRGPLDPDRRPRRHGRRAAAGRDHGRLLDARGRVRREPDRFPPRDPLPRPQGRPRSTRRWRCIEDSRKANGRVSIGLLGNAAEIFPELLRRGIVPDCVTDQTSAHDPLNGYLPAGWTHGRVAASGARAIPSARDRRRQGVDGDARAGDARVPAARRPVVDYGNNIRQMAKEEGVEHAFDFPGFVPAYIRPLFCQGIGPFRWVRASGDPEDIHRTDAKVKELIPDDPHLHRWLDMARERIAFQGLPARICWVGLRDRHRLGLAFNEMVANGRAEAPDRDRPRPPRLRARSPRPTARPRRCRTAPTRSPTGRCSTRCSTPPAARPGSRCTTAAASAWASASMPAGDRRRRHAEAAAALARVLRNDPGTGVMRHADAGYEIAIDCAKRGGARSADDGPLRRRRATQSPRCFVIDDACRSAANRFVQFDDGVRNGAGDALVLAGAAFHVMIVIVERRETVSPSSSVSVQLPLPLNYHLVMSSASGNGPTCC